MTQEIKIVGISGSLRACSTNSGLLRCAQRVSPINSSFVLADISEVPLFNADVEAQGKPAAVQKLVDLVAGADVLVLACPEYNYSMAPALKNALDWVSREPENRALSGKAVAILGAGGGMGTSRAQYHLRQTCVYLNLRPVNKPEVFTNAFTGCFDEAGDVKDSGLTAQISELMQALILWHIQLTK